MNRNDSSFCNNVVDGVRCFGTQKCDEIKSWSGPVATGWKCNVCTLANRDMEAEQCIVCKAPRAKPSGASGAEKTPSSSSEA